MTATEDVAYAGSPPSPPGIDARLEAPRIRLAPCPTCRMLRARCRCLHDIRDPHAFVHATIRRARLVLTQDELDELAAAGMAILYQLAARYKPHIAGHDREGRFSGYAAMYLPRKLGDAWHAMHPEHHHATGCVCKDGHKGENEKCEECGGQDGVRRWIYREKAVSLDALTADDPDRHSVMASRSLDHDLEARLNAALVKASRAEIPTVIKVAGRMKHSDREIADALGIDEDSVRRHIRTIGRAKPSPRHMFRSKEELRGALEVLAERDAARAAAVGNLLGQGETDVGVAEILTHQLHAAGELHEWLKVETGEVRDHHDAIRRVWHSVESGGA